MGDIDNNEMRKNEGFLNHFFRAFRMSYVVCRIYDTYKRIHLRGVADWLILTAMEAGRLAGKNAGKETPFFLD